MTERVPVRSGRIQYSLRVPRPDWIGDKIARTGRPYEPRLLGLLRRLVKAGDLVVDVGANIGNHTVNLALTSGVRVVAYEPNPVCIALLKCNVEENGCADRVTIRPVALGESRGRGQLLHEIQNNLGAVSVTPCEEGDLDIHVLDEDLEFRPLRLMKIDAEGAEPQVLRGGATVISEDRPYLVAEARTPSEAAAVKSVLAPLGYRRIRLALTPTPCYLYCPSWAAAFRAILTPEFAGSLLRVPWWLAVGAWHILVPRRPRVNS